MNENSLLDINFFKKYKYRLEKYLLIKEKSFSRIRKKKMRVKEKEFLIIYRNSINNVQKN